MRLTQIQEEDEFSQDRNHGVQHEVNNFAIYISGRLWKIIAGVGPDDDPAQVRKAEQLRRMCEQKTLSTGKIWSCLETSQEPTGSVSPSAIPPTSSSPVPSTDSEITTNFQVFINGRSWRVFKGAGPDNSLAQRSEMIRLQKMCERKSIQTGRKWEVKPTKAAPTPDEPRPHITEKQINMPARFSPGDEVRVKDHPELQGVLVKMLANNAALVNFEIDDDHDPIESEVDITDLEPATLHEQDVEEKLDANQRRAGQAGPTDPAPLRGKLVGSGLEEEEEEEDVATGSDYTPPKLGTVRANLMHTQEPTVQVQVFKHNTLRGDSYWVTTKVRKFKTMKDAQAEIDRINKQGVAEGLPSSLSNSDYTPGATQKHVNTNCTTCHGRKVMYKLDGKLFADNKVGAVRVKCPTCHGTGDKQGVTEGKFFNSDFIFAKDSTQWQKTIDGGTGTREDPYTAKFGGELGILGSLMRSLALQMAGLDPEDHRNFGPTSNKLYYKFNDKLYIGDGTNKIMLAPTQDVAEGDVFFIEMGNTLIETTVLRANHDTVLLAADDVTMAMLDASSIMEAEYHGRKVPLGKPMQGDVKKFKVYVKDPKTGNVKKVNFGDKTMRIKKSNPARRKSFRARHNCANPGPRTKARYWSCRKW